MRGGFFMGDKYFFVWLKVKKRTYAIFAHFMSKKRHGQPVGGGGRTIPSSHEVILHRKFS